MRGLRLFVALTAAAAMMISLPAAGLAQETAFGVVDYEDAVIADGAVAYWSLAEASGTTAADTAGSNDAAYKGSPTLGASGLALGDTAVDFDGDDDIVKIPNSADINIGGPYDARTVELWFNADVTFRRQVLFEEGGGSRGISMYVYQNRVYANAWNIKNDDANSPWGPVWLSAPIEADTTYHLAMTIDEASGKLKAYINGSPFGQVSGVGALHNHAAKVAIGAMWDDVRYHNANIVNSKTRNHFDGEIDNVAIYNTALSQSEIAAHTVVGGGSVGTAPAVTLDAPVAASTVGGNSVLIQATATDLDPEGTLVSHFRIDSGEWEDMAWNGTSGKYEGTWDATGYSEGSHSIQVRVFDSEMASKATAHQVVVDNISDYGDAVISDGAAIYWRLNEGTGTTAADEVGSVDANYVNGPTLGATGLLPGDSDDAVDFDGENDFVAVPNDPLLNSEGPYTARTIELWFEADDVNSRQVIFEEGGVTRGLSIYVDQGDLYVAGWNTRNDDETTPWGPVWFSAPVFVDTAYHLVVVLDGTGDLEGYLNGLQFGSASAGNLFGHNAGVGIGAMDDDVRFHDGAVTNAGQAYFFDGTIDEVAVYNTALSVGTITTHTTLSGKSVAVAPSIDLIEEPTEGETVSGTVDIFVHASDNVDASADLLVEWRIDNGGWNSTTYNGETDHHEGSWDTTSYGDGSHTLEVRAVDSDSAVTTASISITVNNTSLYATAVNGDGPVAYWRLGESSGSTANDETGNHNETYTGGPTLGVSGLLVGDTDTAVDFDGVDDYIPIGGSSDINNAGPYGARTVELWFEADDVTTRQVLFEEGGVSRGLALYIDDGAMYFIGWNTKNDDATTPWGPVSFSTSIAADTTYHVVLVLDESAGDIKGYVNGTSAGSVTGAGNLFGHTAKVAIGAMDDDVVFHDGAVTNSGQAYYFNGTIDEFAIYNTALSSIEVGNHYAIGAGIPN